VKRQNDPIRLFGPTPHAAIMRDAWRAPRLGRRFWLAGVATALVARPAAAQAMRKITIAVSSASLPGGVARIARQMGLFEQQGLEATVIVMDNATIASTALISGSVDFNTAPGEEVVIANSRRQPQLAVINIYGGFSGVLVLSKAAVAKLQITATASVQERLKALDGMAIASPAATSSSTFALKPAAEAAGAKVRLTYMAQNTMVAALERGAIEGFVASSPFYAMPVISGTGIMWISGPKGEFPPENLPPNQSGLNAMRSFVETNPDVVRRVIAVFTDFAAAVRNRPTEVKAAIAKLFPSLDGPTLDLLFESEAPSFRAARMTAEDMAHVIAYVKRSGLQVQNLEQLDPATMVLPASIDGPR